MENIKRSVLGMLGAGLGKSLAAVVLLASALAVSAAGRDGSAETAVRQATLDECLATALESNRRRPASRHALEMAEAQHRQVLSAYWPQARLAGGYQRLDQAPNIVVPGNGFLPDQSIKLADRDSHRASLEAGWLLYDGGMRRGLEAQTAGLVDMMKQEVRRTDLEIVETVKRFYYGAVLTRQLHRLGEDTLMRMEKTLELTEALYKTGSGTVKKTDWLETRVYVETLRAVLADLEKNRAMAQAALANVMGLPWHASVAPVDGEMPFAPFAAGLDDLVGTAYQFNPDWAKVEAGLQAAEGAILTAASGHAPKLALTGSLYRWWNDYRVGLATDVNKEGWVVGAGVEIPLFSGFLTQNKIAEARAQLAKIKAERVLLQEGIGLQVRDIFLALSAAEKAHRASRSAMESAEASRDLNARAYQQGLVETEKVIRSQLLEAFMSAQHYRARYEHLALRARLDLTVGTEVLKALAGKPAP